MQLTAVLREREHANAAEFEQMHIVAVRTTTRMSDPSGTTRSLLSTSKPLMIGMIKSSTIPSGGDCKCTISRAVRPLAATFTSYPALVKKRPRTSRTDGTHAPAGYGHPPAGQLH